MLVGGVNRAGICTTSRLGRVLPVGGGDRAGICTTSRFGRNRPIRARMDGGVPAGRGAVLFGNSPKQGPCAAQFLPSRDVVREVPDLASLTLVFLPSRDLAQPISPKPGQSAQITAQRPASGELSGWGREKGRASAQRPVFGELRAFGQSTRLIKALVREVRYQAPLPSRDLVRPNLSQAETLCKAGGENSVSHPRFSPKAGRCVTCPCACGAYGAVSSKA